MYRQYKYLPEVNRPCCRATRGREYQAHMDALNRIKTHKGTLNNSPPNTPQTIGRNYKRYENEQQRNHQIRKDNMRLVEKMDRIAREEHYPRAVPQRPYTLQGSRQKDEMKRITGENQKLLNAVQDRKPVLNRNDWFHHKIDHQYQLQKMSEYHPTLPMSEILKKELGTKNGTDTGTSYAGSSCRKSSTSQSKRSQQDSNSRLDLEEENQNRADALMGDENESENQNEEKGKLENQLDGVAGGLIDNTNDDESTTDKEKQNGEEEERKPSESSSGRLDNHLNGVAGGLIDEAETSSQKQSTTDKDLKDENDDDDFESQESDPAGPLDNHLDNIAGGLIDEAEKSSEPNKSDEKQSSANEEEKVQSDDNQKPEEKGRLEEHTGNITNSLLG